MTTVTIVPEPGNLKVIAKELLALADDSRDVNYVMWPEPGFQVPESLAAKFVAARQGETVTEGDVVEEPVRPKKAVGRPKKIQGGQ